MEKSFSWRNFDRMAKVLESLGYVVIVFGPLTGITLLIVGDLMVRMIGVAMIFASILISLYHISFSLLMNGIRDLTRQLETIQRDQLMETSEDS